MSGAEEKRVFPSSPSLTPQQMVAGVEKPIGDWTFDAVSIGFPAPVKHNRPTQEPVNLGGWYLTDDRDNLRRWTFPSVALAPGGFLVVFASGNNAVDPAGNLHTNFLG